MKFSVPDYESDDEVSPPVNIFKAAEMLAMTSNIPLKIEASPDIFGADVTFPTTPDAQAQGLDTPSTAAVPSLTGSPDSHASGGDEDPTTPAWESLTLTPLEDIPVLELPPPKFVNNTLPDRFQVVQQPKLFFYNFAAPVPRPVRTGPLAGETHYTPAPTNPRSTKRVDSHMDRPRRHGRNDISQFRAKAGRYIPRRGSIHQLRIEHEQRMLAKTHNRCVDEILATEMGGLTLYPWFHGMTVDMATAITLGRLNRLSL